MRMFLTLKNEQKISSENWWVPDFENEIIG